MPGLLPLSPLDLVSAKLTRASRPLDFAVVVRFVGAGPGREKLLAGAQSALRAFPPSGSTVDGRSWRWLDAPLDLRVLEVEGETAAREAIEAFIDAPFDPHGAPPVRELEVRDVSSGTVRLVARFHHCAFDGVTTGLWLLIQLGVAAGTLPPVEERQDWRPPALRPHDAPVRKSRFARCGPSQRVWSSAQRPSHQRRWATVDLEAEPLRAAVACVPDVTYNDLLACSWLETLIRWNAAHGARHDNLALWLPVNIRQHAFSGFGNGSSRIRVYGRWERAADATARCTLFRKQVAWSKSNGEWFVPADSALLRQPDWVLVPFLRGWLGRPWVDMGSAVFSHMEQIGPAAELLPMVAGTEWVTMLHKRFPVGLVGATLGAHTSLSMTWDPGMLPDDAARELLAQFEATVHETASELGA
jgi:hypothetical protein